MTMRNDTLIQETQDSTCEKKPPRGHKQGKPESR